MGYDRSFPFDSRKENCHHERKNVSENCLSFPFENWKENCHHVHIPFNLKENKNTVFSVLKKLPIVIRGLNKMTSRRLASLGMMGTTLRPFQYNTAVMVRGVSRKIGVEGLNRASRTADKKSSSFLQQTGDFFTRLVSECLLKPLDAKYCYAVQGVSGRPSIGVPNRNQSVHGKYNLVWVLI